MYKCILNLLTLKLLSYLTLARFLVNVYIAFTSACSLLINVTYVAVTIIKHGLLLDYDSDYSHIYGRLPLPTRFRQFPGPPSRPMYVSEWE